MSLPTLSGTARLTDDPNLRFTPSGVPVVKVSLAFNSRKLNKQTNTWEDDSVFFVEATAFNQAAENIAESLSKGSEVVVTGRLKTQQWEDRESGQKRSRPELLIDTIGPSLRFATAKVTKAARGGAQGQQQGYGQQPGTQAANDPWSQPSGSYSDEPPF